MKKVININFQGRVIPIEETAYDMLTRYVESLRLFFANEEGKDEIINDIEGRIAELFGETLKKGSTCITEADVNTIINSMGRPEDFEADEAKVHSQLGGESTGQQSYTYEQRAHEQKRLYRDENHKVVAGVCSGIANYLGIDPVVVRILVLVTLGVTLIPYLILWVAVPSSASTVIGSRRKRLFRDPDDKIIAGVCSGLAQYFGINVWIPRALFLIPFFSFVFTFNHSDFFWWDFPHFLSWSFSPGSVFIYVILWLVLPEAKSAADKLEMKGEKVDLNNIKTTIQGDLEGFKDRAQQFGSEIKEKAQKFGGSFYSSDPDIHSTSQEIDELKKSSSFESAGKKGRSFGSEGEPVVRRSRRGLGDIIALLAKIFAYFILGCILFSIVVSLFSLGVVFTSMLPAKDYIIRSGWQNLFAWGTLILFIWVPVVGIITWIIRRVAKKRGNRQFIRFTFISLWMAGIICLVGLILSLRNDFRYRNYPVEQTIPLANAAVNKLEVRTYPTGRYYNHNWLKLEPFATFDEDTVYVRNIQLRVIKSDNDSFKVTMLKLVNGASRQQAEEYASKIHFSATQRDTSLLLDRGIAITPNEKFRNQHLYVTVAVPVGKRIYISENENWGEGFSMHFFNRDNENYWDWGNDRNNSGFNWRSNIEYVMTQKGLERVDKSYNDEDNMNNNEEDNDNSNKTLEDFRKSKEQMERQKEQKLKELQEIDKELQQSDSTHYHYQPSVPGVPKRRKTTFSTSAAVATVPERINDVLFIKFAL